MKLAVILLALLAGDLASGAQRAVLRTLPELLDARRDLSNVGRPFDVEASILSYNRRPIDFEWLLVVGDGTNTAMVFERNEPGCPATNLEHMALNDRVRIRGTLYHYPPHNNVCIGYKDVRLLRHQPIDHDDDAFPRDLFKPESLYRTFRFTGVVRDAFRDDSDANFIYMTMNCRGEALHLMMLHSGREKFDPNAYIGAEVAASGYCAPPENCLRRHIGRLLILTEPNGLVLTSRPKHSEAPARDIDSLQPFPLSDIPTMGRIQAVGKVIAAWHGDTMLVQTASNNVVKVQVEGDLPTCGQTIRAVGLPETDLYFMNLVHAGWEHVDAAPTPPAAPKDLTPQELLTDARGRRQILVEAHGKTVRIKGVIRYLSATQGPDARIHIDSGGFLIPVDVSSTPGLLQTITPGCLVAATGVCVLDISSYGQAMITPKARGFFIVPRSTADIVVLSRPPWWTAQRLLAVLGVVLAALLAILVWNRVLNHLVDRRSRQLFKTQIARTVSELRVEERTRLAVELHDSMSQNISSAALQVSAAERLLGVDLDKSRRHLDIAAKTLLSCREELHNCIWDLRSHSLDDPHIGNAIRRMLSVSLGDVKTSIRFNVLRQRLSDNTVHLILKIVRELAVNAVRHGHATSIRIAGALDVDGLRFSVSDNGTGFDVGGRPGVAEGHFGLQGIAERARQFGGEMSIQSAPGKGARVTVTLKSAISSPVDGKDPAAREGATT